MDFNESTFFTRLSFSSFSQYDSLISPILTKNESVFETYSGARDGVVFTNKRLIAINIKGIGTKKEITSFPYSKIQTFSIETAGVFDMDAELEVVFGGIGKIKFNFTKTSDLFDICRFLSEAILGESLTNEKTNKTVQPTRPLSAPVTEEDRKEQGVAACVVARTPEEIKKEREKKGWICKKCKTENPFSRRTCLECGEPK